MKNYHKLTVKPFLQSNCVRDISPDTPVLLVLIAKRLFTIRRFFWMILSTVLLSAYIVTPICFWMAMMIEV